MSKLSALILKCITDDPGYRNERIAQVTRQKLHDEFLKAGYSERTAKNHLTKSQKNSTIQLLYDNECIYQKVNKGYLIDVHKLALLAEASKTRTKSATHLDRVFPGNPPVGDKWKIGGDVEGGKVGEGWVYYYKRYDKGAYNIKIFAANGAKFKANYWLQAKNGLLVNNVALACLKRERFEIYESILSIVKEYHND